MTEQRQPTLKDLEERKPAQKIQNPHIINFCKALVEKTGEKHEPAVLRALLNRMYDLYEFMLGKNMVKSLPEEIRKEYLQKTEDLRSLNYDIIKDYFDANVTNYEQIMKETMVEFTKVFLSNADLQKGKVEAFEQMNPNVGQETGE